MKQARTQKSMDDSDARTHAMRAFANTGRRSPIGDLTPTLTGIPCSLAFAHRFGPTVFSMLPISMRGASGPSLYHPHQPAAGFVPAYFGRMLRFQHMDLEYTWSQMVLLCWRPSQVCVSLRAVCASLAWD